MRVDGGTAGQPLLVGGMEPVVLRREPTLAADKPEFLEAVFLPGRGMSLFQVRARFPGLGEIDLLASPSLDEARRQLDGGPDDYMGVHSFRFGGAFLLPFANRIRGRSSSDGCTIETNIPGGSVCLPADWQGQRPGAEKCAIHGLILASKMHVDEIAGDHVAATLDAGDFGGHWLSTTFVRIEAWLRADAIELAVTARNTGGSVLPMGIGWHPYFEIPSGRREQARIHLPARQRALVNNYDDVFPTGQLEAVRGTPYDFTAPEGAPLGARYFDDTFVDLIKTAEGHVTIQISDPAANYGVRLTALSPHIRAIQLYSRPDRPFVVVEPQFNWSDPFGSVWPPGTDTGMALLKPGEEISWAVLWEIFTS